MISRLAPPRLMTHPVSSDLAATLAEMRAANARMLIDVLRAGVSPITRLRADLDRAADRLRLTLTGYAQLAAPDTDSRDEIAGVWRELACVLAARVTLDGGTIPPVVYFGPTMPPLTRLWRYTHPDHEGDRLRLYLAAQAPQQLAFSAFGGSAAQAWALAGEVDPTTGEMTPWSGPFHRRGVYVAQGNPDYRHDTPERYREANEADIAHAYAVDGEAA